mgnify:CR=1 FL=1
MPRVSGDGFSVNTDSLRDDATKWTDQADDLRQGREAVENSCGMRVDGSTEILIAALAEGEKELASITDSLRRVASGYEDTESEIFKKE